MLKVGMIGFSTENGHPFSFSAICNGFRDSEFKKTEWLGILAYLQSQPESEFCALDAKVTHVWTQHLSVTQSIMACSKVECLVEDPLDMLGEVDAVIIARDDFECHKNLSKPFLENGVAVFIDKPLTLDVGELLYFRPYLESGLLMSCSGFYFAKELDFLREGAFNFGEIRHISAVVINGWEKYGIHMLDAVYGALNCNPVSVSANLDVDHQSLRVEMDDGLVFSVDALGRDVKVFNLNLYATEGVKHVNITNNFVAFKRTLDQFFKQVRTRRPSISPQSTLRSIKTLIAGKMALELGRTVNITELDL